MRLLGKEKWVFFKIILLGRSTKSVDGLTSVPVWIGKLKVDRLAKNKRM